MKFLHENRKEGCTTNAIDEAARKGHISVVKYLCKNRKERYTQAALIGAKSNGYTTLLRFLCNTVYSQII